MLNGKEITTIVIVTLVLSFAASLETNLRTIAFVAVSILIILLVNVIAKKIMAHYVESEVEIRLWEVKRYGYKAGYHFKKPVPAGIILPIFVSLFTFGYITWLASIVFDVKPKPYRVGKRHGLYSFSEMTEWHIGLIAAAGIFANMAIAVVGYLIGLPEEMLFVQLSIFYTFFNLIPLSDLDGNKIFFGSLWLWTFLATVAAIATIATFLIL